MYIPLSVRTVQQGLMTISSEEVSVPEPGPVDGVWGPRTRNSLASFIRLMHGADQDAIFSDLAEIDATPARSAVVMLEDFVARQLVDDAGAYLRTHERLNLAQSGGGAGGAGGATTIGPHLDPEEPLASYSGGSGLSTAAKVALGVLALGAIGGVIYVATRKKR